MASGTCFLIELIWYSALSMLVLAALTAPASPNSRVLASGIAFSISRIRSLVCVARSNAFWASSAAWRASSSYPPVTHHKPAHNNLLAKYSFFGRVCRPIYAPIPVDDWCKLYIIIIIIGETREAMLVRGRITSTQISKHFIPLIQQIPEIHQQIIESLCEFPFFLVFLLSSLSLSLQ